MKKDEGKTRCLKATHKVRGAVRQTRKKSGVTSDGGEKEAEELLKLKRLPAADRAEIASWQEETKSTREELRVRIEERFGIKLPNPWLLESFWTWQRRQADWDHLGLMMEQDEEHLKREFPDASRDRIRDAVIKRGYAAADMEKDLPLSLRVAALDLKDRTVEQDERRLALLEEKAETASSGGKSGQPLSTEETQAMIHEILHRV
jgi:hypothetical protein